jgi:hypothetical protein
MSSRRLALLAALAFVLTARADEPPKPAPGSGVLNPNANPQMRSAGQIAAVLSKVDGSTITIKTPQLEPSKGSGGGGSRRRSVRVNVTEKDHDIDLATDVKVRWHDLPKKADGKSYTDKEYQALRDPPGTPGYKADMSDLKAGQTVRLYLSKGSGKDDKVVATVVMILADPPKGSEPKDVDKPKKKKKE